MFEIGRRRSGSRTAFQMLTLIFHWTARSLTTSNRNPVIAVIMEMIQSLMMLLMFYGMFKILGMSGSRIPGADFLLYLMSGIFCFLIHTKAVKDIMSSEGPLSPMMLHAPMNTTVAIASAALSSLYKQIVSVAAMLFIYDAITDNVEFYRLIPTVGVFLLSWASGCCVGLLFLAMQPFAPRIVNILSMVYRRMNMLFSGKMFLANTLPGTMLPMFDWNPLFHIIDQCRGYVFINYHPHFSTVLYPIKVSLIFLVIGLMAEFSARRNASLSKTVG